MALLVLVSFYSFLKFAVENHTENHTWLVAKCGDLTYWLGGKKKNRGEIQGFWLKKHIKGSEWLCTFSIDP